MPSGSYVRTKEHNEKIGISNLGNKNWLGKKHTIQSNEKNRLAHIGRVASEETKKKMSLSHIGNKTLEKTKNKLRIILTGRKNPWVVGLPHLFKKGNKIASKNLGIKNHAWKGGVSFHPYSLDWTKKLKNKIRKRDNFACQMCLLVQDKKNHSVHHVDYNKKNCKENNLITLCNSCHIRTNFNREYWINYFMNLIKK